jgi:acyl-CoA reductase-like NAD-dependent aldehyde dehydrogenase
MFFVHFNPKKVLFHPNLSQPDPQGMDKTTDVGPMVTREAKVRAEMLIQQGIEDGAKCVLDGRNVKVSQLQCELHLKHVTT